MAAWHDGERAMFEENCTPLACQLRAFEELPHLDLWLWMAELASWSASGIPIDDVQRGWDMETIRAFVEFRARLTELAARQEARSNGD